MDDYIDELLASHEEDLVWYDIEDAPDPDDAMEL